jgi:hypothetical protein
MIKRDENGVWTAKNVPKGMNPTYAKALVDFFNALDPLFDKAQQKSDFEFVCTLINVQGTQDAGWDSFETTQDIFETFNNLKTKVKYNKEQLHLFLVLYGLILEASYPYDTLCNLLRVISGDRYSAFCFPDIKIGKSGKTRPVFASEKLAKIKAMAKSLGLEKNIEPLADIFDKELRNAIFHSDYSTYDDEVRLIRPTKIYSTTQIMEIINKTLAYHEVFVRLVKMYKASYEKPEVIDVHPDFSKHPNEKVIVMVRKGTGAIGIKDNWTSEEIAQGKIPFRLCKLLPYEQKMLQLDPLLAEFPENKADKYNKILKLFPEPIKKGLLPLFERLL